MRLPDLVPGACICVIFPPFLLIIERLFTYSLASGYLQPPAGTGLRAARLAGQALRLAALPAPGAAEVSGVKGGRRPFPQETRSVLEAGGAARSLRGAPGR